MGGQRRQKRGASRSVKGLGFRVWGLGSYARPLGGIMLLMRPRGPLMRAWGSRAEPADAHDARPLGGIMGHPRPSHFSCLNPRKPTGPRKVGGTGVRPNSASQKARGQQGYSRDDPG